MRKSSKRIVRTPMLMMNMPATKTASLNVSNLKILKVKRGPGLPMKMPILSNSSRNTVLKNGLPSPTTSQVTFLLCRSNRQAVSRKVYILLSRWHNHLDPLVNK